MHFFKRFTVWLLMRIIAIAFWIAGWRAEGRLPDVPKMVIIGAPHTSNWDYFAMLAIAAQLNVIPATVIKAEAFKSPLGFLLRWAGSIPLDRKNSRNAVDVVANHIKAAERIVLAISPEGTRRKTKRWRSGFYHIAHKANVPLVMAAINYRRKRVTISPPLYPSGDIVADMQTIRTFYEEVNPLGRYHENFGEIKVIEEVRAQREQNHPEEQPVSEMP